MATTLLWAVVTTVISVDIVSFISVGHFLLSPLADLVISGTTTDFLAIQPAADFVTCNKLASGKLRLVLPFVCLPLLTHHALEAASIVVEHIQASDDPRLQSETWINRKVWKSKRREVRDSYWDIWVCWSRWDFSWPTHRVPGSHPSPKIPEFGYIIAFDTR